MLLIVWIAITIDIKFERAIYSIIFEYLIYFPVLFRFQTQKNISRFLQGYELLTIENYVCKAGVDFKGIENAINIGSFQFA